MASKDAPLPVIAQGDFRGPVSWYWVWIRSGGVSGLALGKQERMSMKGGGGIFSDFCLYY